MKLVPWSVWITLGRPKVEKNLIRLLIIVLAVIVRRGIASRYRVALHIMVSRNWLPVRVFGNGPTQSIITRSNGSPITGIGWSGTRGSGWFTFPVSWHTWQVLQYCTMSDFNPGQKKCRRTLLYVLVIPKCPDHAGLWASDNTCCRSGDGTTTCQTVSQSSPVMRSPFTH